MRASIGDASPGQSNFDVRAISATCYSDVARKSCRNHYLVAGAIKEAILQEPCPDTTRDNGRLRDLQRSYERYPPRKWKGSLISPRVYLTRSAIREEHALYFIFFRVGGDPPFVRPSQEHKIALEITRPCVLLLRFFSVL